MEDDVDDRVPLRSGGVARERLAQCLAGPGVGHVADGGDAAGRGGAGAAPEIVDPARRAGRVDRRKVDVRIDPAGEDEQPGGVDLVAASKPGRRPRSDRQ